MDIRGAGTRGEAGGGGRGPPPHPGPSVLAKYFDFCHKRNGDPVKSFKEPHDNRVNGALDGPCVLTEAINAKVISEVVNCYGIRDLHRRRFGSLFPPCDFASGAPRGQLDAAGVRNPM